MSPSSPMFNTRYYIFIHCVTPNAWLKKCHHWLWPLFYIIKSTCRYENNFNLISNSLYTRYYILMHCATPNLWLKKCHHWLGPLFHIVKSTCRYENNFNLIRSSLYCCKFQGQWIGKIVVWNDEFKKKLILSDEMTQVRWESV